MANWAIFGIFIRMNSLRKILLSLLGEKKYLSLLSSSFQFLYKTVGMGKDYQDIYFLKKYIRPGDFVVDIGAHLGYFTLELSRLVKDAGKVIAIEPVSKFHAVLQEQIWKKNLRNVELIQAAMGGDQSFVEMGIPKVNKTKKFAYARIKNSNLTLDYIESEKVKNINGDNLLLNLPRLDFIKCDVEGVEIAVFNNLMKTVERHRPILLCELADKNERRKLLEMVRPFDYSMFILEQNKLHELDADSPRSGISHNHYFVPAVRKSILQDQIA
jgi:FkbM family methyltransferase